MNNQQDDNCDNTQAYPPNLSYQKLKDMTDNCSSLYRLWLDTIYIATMTEQWLGCALYPVLILWIFFYTKYWYLALLYMLWFYYDRGTPHNGGRKRYYFWKSWLTSKYFREYHPVGLVKTADLPADKNYLLAVFPHGIFCTHGCTNFCHDTNICEKLFPQIDFHVAMLDINFNLPISRDLKLLKGFVGSSEESLLATLTRKPNSGTGLMVVVGGAAESFNTDSQEYKLTLKTRKGFVRVALKTGASLVPVLGFGENRLYNLLKPTASWLMKIQYFLYKFTTIAPIIPLGRSYGPITVPFIPKNLPVISVVGKPIDVPKIENPTEEEIDYYHQKFKDELYELFEKFKEKYDVAGKDAKLIYV